MFNVVQVILWQNTLFALSMIMILQVTQQKPFVVSTGIRICHPYAFILSMLSGGLKGDSLIFGPLPNLISQTFIDVLRL